MRASESGISPAGIGVGGGNGCVLFGGVVDLLRLFRRRYGSSKAEIRPWRPATLVHPSRPSLRA